MTWRDSERLLFQQVRDSPLLHGAITAGIVLLAIVATVMILTLVTWTLHRYFTHHPLVTRAHRVLVYILTMLGVLVLLFAAVLGAMLPIVPGFVFLLAALLLLRRYYKHPWIEARIHALRFKRHVQRKLRQHLRRHKNLKMARMHPPSRGGGR